jgi:hypothetical protein
MEVALVALAMEELVPPQIGLLHHKLHPDHHPVGFHSQSLQAEELQFQILDFGGLAVGMADSKGMPNHGWLLLPK